MENNQIAQEEITLDNLKSGKFAITDIPRPERERLWKEEYETLPDGAKQLADAVNWKSKPFFQGKKKDGSDVPFKDWQEFAEDVRTNLPVANERLRHLAQEKAKEKLEAEATIQKLQKQIAQMSAMQKMQMEKELRKEKAAVTSEMEEAFEDQDKQKFKDAEKRRADIEIEEKALKQFEEEPEPKVVPIAPEIVFFKANNPWFEKDKRMTNYARGLDNELRAQHPTLSLAQRLQMVEDDVKAEFAEKFKIEEETPTAPAVESGRNAGRLSMPRDKELSFGQLPANIQSDIERLVKHGVVASKAEAVRDYNQRASR